MKSCQRVTGLKLFVIKGGDKMEIIKIVCAVFVILAGLVFIGVDVMQNRNELNNPISYFIKRIIIVIVLAIVVYNLM